MADSLPVADSAAPIHQQFHRPAEGNIPQDSPESSQPVEVVYLYPWSKGEGLCPVLRDPGLWGDALDIFEDFRAIRKAAKQARIGIPDMLSPDPSNRQDYCWTDANRKGDCCTDGRTFFTINRQSAGQAVVALLESPSGRYKLFRCLDQVDISLAGFLYCETLRRYKNAQMPDEKDVCYEQTDPSGNGSGFLLDVDKFAVWLQWNELRPESLRPLALYACAFALLQPKDASAILQSLLRRDTAFRNLLASPPAPSSQKRKGVRNIAFSRADGVGGPTPSASSPSIPGNAALEEMLQGDASPPNAKKNEPNLLQRLEQALPPADQMSLEELRQAAEFLLLHGKELDQRLAELKQSEERVRARVEEISRLPWIRGRVVVDLDERNASSAQSARVREEMLAGWEQDSERVLHAHRQLEALLRRLQEPMIAFMPGGAPLDAVAARVEKEIQGCQIRFEEMVRREQVVKEFLEAWLRAPLEEAVPALRDADENRWVSLAEFVVRTPQSEVGCCASLAGRTDLLGLAAAALWPSRPELALALLERTVGRSPLSDDGIRHLLRCAPPALLPEAAQRLPAATPTVVREWFAAAIVANQPVRLKPWGSWLDSPALGKACARFYRAVLKAFRRGTLPEPLRKLAQVVEPSPSEGNKLREAWLDVERSALQGDRQAAALRSLLHRLSASDYAATDFGERSDVVEGQTVLVRPEGLVEPTMLLSWPAVVRGGSVPLWTFLVDGIRQALQPLSPAQAVDAYLCREDFLAAERAAGDHPSLCERVTAERTRRRQETRNAHADLLRRAEKALGRDEYIDIFLAEIDQALEELRFADCRQLFADLEPHVRRYEERNNPERLELMAMLREGGQSATGEESLEELRPRAEAFRQLHCERRLHILYLARLRDPTALPPILAEHWSLLARQLDRPALWPDAESSLQLSQHLQTIARFLAGQYQHGEGDQESIDLAVRIGDWVGVHLQDALESRSPNAAQARQALAELENMIVNFFPIRRLVKLLESPAPTPPIADQDRTAS